MRDIIFHTDRFNRTEIKENFINDCCFGEDLAGWLRERLIEAGAAVEEPFQEDWGWAMFANLGGTKYFLGMGLNEPEDDDRPNFREWRVIIEVKGGLKSLLRSRPADDTMPDLIKRIATEAGFADVREEM